MHGGELDRETVVSNEGIALLHCALHGYGAARLWPISGEYYSSDAAVRSMQTTLR
jgi:hypothetical protein